MDPITFLSGAFRVDWSGGWIEKTTRESLMDINSIALASERIKKKLLKVSGGQKPSDLCRQDLDNRGSDTIETHRRLRASLEFRVWTKFEIWALTLPLVQ